ncbi:MAG: polysaccharide deacetylase family protein [Chloroflexi bacterium]|nr:polysaccharide deacetylase family protein [Chloroflexota bacterium]
MQPAHRSQTNTLLGYPADARLLIINADDFGMCHATNAAILRALTDGVVTSTTLMAPCPWALHAIRLLKEHPELPFGVHLTAICDGPDYRWGPIAPRDHVPSLVDETGRFYRFERMSEFLAQLRLDELEVEFRTQIETVLAAGLHPTHLDWHALRIAGRPDIFDVMVRLARGYGLALRVYGRSIIDTVQGLGLPCNDHDFLDSYMLETHDKAAGYAQRLRDLPVGLSEWAVHPGLADGELLAIEPDGAAVRQADLDAMLSQQVREVIREEGIILLSYQPLQAIWRAN